MPKCRSDKQFPKPTSRVHVTGRTFGRLQRIESKRVSHVSAKHTLHRENVKQDEENQNHRADALQHVQPVFTVSVMAHIRLPGHGNVDAVNRVIQNRQVDKRPFHHRQKRQAVNFVHLHLIRIGPGGVSATLNQCRIDQKMNNQVSAEE